jgi:creatinine amidohydrolase
MKLGEMTWPDTKAMDKSTIVPVYPIASFEQHGPHLPFLTDTLETEEIVRRLDQRLPNDVLCLPTQWLGYSFHHTRLGCLTATSDTHINLMVETVGCLIEAGFSKVMIVNGHGGNEADMAVALQKLKEKYPDSRVFGVSYWKVAQQRLDEIREAGPYGWGHAGEMETSMMLVIRPDLVKAERRGLDGTHPESAHGEQVAQFLRIDEMTEQGVYGDPSYGTAEKGEHMLDAAADSLAEVVRDIQAGKF